MLKYECPCCGCRTISEPAMWDICPVCFWEDDGDLSGGGANHVNLEQARANFLRFGACEESMVPNVRKPYESEITDRYIGLIGGRDGSDSKRCTDDSDDCADDPELFDYETDE